MSNDIFSELRAAYLQAMYLGSGRAADQVVQRALDSQIRADALYLDIFQPTAYEIGRLWQQNLFTVAQEHLATAIIERQMGELHSHFVPRQPRGKSVLIGCVAEEFHRLGARMVADFFELDGWTVHFLGAAVPGDTFAEMARDLKVDLVGLSVQMVFHVPAVLDLMAELNHQQLGGLPVMVGGLPFIQQPELYQTLGASFSGANAAEAVSKANQLFA